MVFLPHPDIFFSMISSPIGSIDAGVHSMSSPFSNILLYIYNAALLYSVILIATVSGLRYNFA